MIPPLTPDTTIDRRVFIGAASSCMGWMLLAGAAPAAAARRFGRPLRLPLQQEPWGRIEPLGEGVWALVSTPLVDHPDGVRVTETQRRGMTMLELTTAPGDMGKIIGRQGRTAAALRTLLAVTAERHGKRAQLDIKD